MRELTFDEISQVAGAGDECSADSGGAGNNQYGGVSDTESVGAELINIYEGVVAAASHIIERVASSF
jgi:hypothetical protein